MTSTILLAVAFVVLLAGVVSAVVPGVPTGLVSLAGVGIYWWATDFTEPGTVVLAVLAGICVLTVVADWVSEVVAAKFGGAATSTTIVAGVFGLVLLFFTGPVGMLLGAGAVVFVLEYRRQRDINASATAAGAYVLGFFASAVVQAFLALSVLIAMGWITVF